jgi:hypothetical protein
MEGYYGKGSKSVEVAATAQVVATTVASTRLYGLSLTAAAAAADAVIREGGSGGTVRWTLGAPVEATASVSFDPPLEIAAGLHATLVGVGAVLDLAFD